MITRGPIIPWPPKPAPAAKPMPGAGTLLALGPGGYSVSAPDRGATYPHPFKPSLSGLALRFSRGLVENREPTIKGVRIGGTATAAQPELAIEAAVANAAGESWCCVEVHPDAQGELPAESKIEIVHTRTPRSLSPEVGRQALCMIVWREGNPWQVLPIVHFNLRYARVLPPAGSGAARHVFF